MKKYLYHLNVFEMLQSSFDVLQSGFLLLQLLLDRVTAVKAVCRHLSHLAAALDSLTVDHIAMRSGQLKGLISIIDKPEALTTVIFDTTLAI